ncbi:MAG: GerMN domain-containing protein [Clostridia bacterium]|nr:GerMN domain-containing protein [Clostridia bacterium]
MKRVLYLFFVLCFFTGCTPEHGTSVRLYFVSADKKEISVEERQIEADSATMITETINALLKGPSKPGMTQIIPRETALRSVRINGTVAELDMSAPFDTGNTTDRLLSRYTLIYTVCSLPNVQKVKISVEGVPLAGFKNNEPLGALGIADLALSELVVDTQALATLYYTDSAGTRLVPESRQLSLLEGKTIAYAVVEALIAGTDVSSLHAPLSPETTLISTDIRNETCYVNFGKNFIEKHAGDTTEETMAVYSIVNSLCALPGIEKVCFLIEGETIEYFGHFDFRQSFSENTALCQQ